MHSKYPILGKLLGWLYCDRADINDKCIGELREIAITDKSNSQHSNDLIVAIVQSHPQRTIAYHILQKQLSLQHHILL